MIARALLLIALILAPVLGRTGPIIVRDGAGESEFNLLFIRERLPELFATCLLDPACGENLSTTERESWTQAFEFLRTAKFSFLTSKEMGAEVVHVTREASVVRFNKDFLWKHDPATRAFNSLEAADLLTEVAATQLVKEASPDFKNRFATFIRTLLVSNTTFIDSLRLQSAQLPDGTLALLLKREGKIQDAKVLKLKTLVRCEEFGAPSGEPESFESSPLNFLYHVNTGEDVELIFDAKITFTCANDSLQHETMIAINLPIRVQSKIDLAHIKKRYYRPQ